jgi:hypothetical protein
MANQERKRARATIEHTAEQNNLAKGNSSVSSQKETSPIPTPTVLGTECLCGENPRSTMYRSLPGFMQSTLTALTGQPYEGEETHHRTPWHHLGSAAFAHSAGTAGTALCIAHGGLAWALVPATTLVALHGARKLRNVIMHQCAHDNFIRNRSFDRLLGKAISVALLTEEFDYYKRSHIEDHHSSRHQTIFDPTVVFLFRDLGVRPGMAPCEMWRRLFISTVSPFYHFRFLAARLRSHFNGTSLRHKICLIAHLCLVSGTVTALDAGRTFLLSWLLPVTLLYQVSTAFRLASRHIFISNLPKKRDKSTLGAFTLGIFIGTPCPKPGKSILRNAGEWSWWWTRMVAFHAPCRLGVLVGDGPAHDFHHRFPRYPDWANYTYARADDQRNLSEGWPPYREVWGLQWAIDATFRSLSAADPSDYPIEALCSRQAIRKPEE